VKVIVFGSRSWTNRLAIRERLARLPAGSIVVHGKSPGGGADLFADEEARALGFSVIPVPINADDRAKAGTTRSAPIHRNVRMARTHRDADVAIGFWDGVSPGTRHMTNAALDVGVPVELHRVAVVA